MDWRLFADIAERAGAHRVSVEVDDGSTVAEALEALFDEHPDLREVVLEGGELADHLTVLRNGANVEAAGEGLETPVEDEDELALFPPISGG